MRSHISSVERLAGRGIGEWGKRVNDGSSQWSHGLSRVRANHVVDHRPKVIFGVQIPNGRIGSSFIYFFIDKPDAVSAHEELSQLEKLFLHPKTPGKDCPSAFLYRNCRRVGVAVEEGRKALHALLGMGTAAWVFPDTDYIVSFSPLRVYRYLSARKKKMPKESGGSF